jgi:recombination protein RecA
MAKKKSMKDASPEEIIDSCLEENPVIPGPIPCWIPTGCSQLDWAIGGDGWPCGRMIEVHGMESSGKTMLAMLACRNTLKMGGTAIYLDMEAAFNDEWAAKIGLPTEGLILRTPKDLEEVHDIIEAIVDNHQKFNSPIIIVWDSLAASASRASVRKKSAKETDPIGAEARLNGSFFRRKVLKDMRNLPICLMIINQVRQKIGGNPYDNETTPGGLAVKFYASLRVSVKKKRTMKPKREGALPAGAFVRAKMVKNKVARPYMIADFPIYFNRGIDDIYAVMYFCELNKILSSTSNGRFYWNDKTYTRADLWRLFKESDSEFQKLRSIAKKAFYSETPLGEESYDTSDDD